VNQCQFFYIVLQWCYWFKYASCLFRTAPWIVFVFKYLTRVTR